MASAILKLSEDGKFPYLSEGTSWYRVVESFVRDWIDHAGAAALDAKAVDFYSDIRKATKGQSYVLPNQFSKDNLIKLLSQFIWTVTAYHEVVGTVVDYTEKPSGMGFRALSDESCVSTDVQSYLMIAALTASTAIRMPDLVGKFKNFFGVEGAPDWERNCWDQFQRNIQHQSRVVRNARRATEFRSMDPSRFECAVSV